MALGKPTNGGCGWSNLPINIEGSGEVTVTYEEKGLKPVTKTFNKPGFMPCGVGWITVSAPGAKMVKCPKRKQTNPAKNVIKFWRMVPADVVLVQF